MPNNKDLYNKLIDQTNIEILKCSYDINSGYQTKITSLILDVA